MVIFTFQDMYASKIELSKKEKKRINRKKNEINVWFQVAKNLITSR